MLQTTAAASWSNVLAGRDGDVCGLRDFLNRRVTRLSGIRSAALTGAPTWERNLQGRSGAGSTCSAIHSLHAWLTTGLPAQSTMGRMDLGIAPSVAAGNTVYASIAECDLPALATNLGVWVTTNGGTSWTQTAAPDVCQFQCWYDDVLKVDPNNKNTIFLGGSSVLDANGKPPMGCSEHHGRIELVDGPTQSARCGIASTLTRMRWPFSSFPAEKSACTSATTEASGEPTTQKP